MLRWMVSLLFVGIFSAAIFQQSLQQTVGKKTPLMEAVTTGEETIMTTLSSDNTDAADTSMAEAATEIGRNETNDGRNETMMQSAAETLLPSIVLTILFSIFVESCKY